MASRMFHHVKIRATHWKASAGGILTILILSLTLLLVVGAHNASPLKAETLSSSGSLKKTPSEPNLSPKYWPAGELEKFKVLNNTPGQPHPMAEGTKGVIAGTTGALAVRAGLEALKQGGSAADAALTTSLAQISLAAGCWVSYSGIMTGVYYEARTGKVYSLNAGFNTVQGENDPLSIPGTGKPSGRTALVPGYMAGVQALHDKFGKLPFAKIVEPAIYFAENGIEITPTLDRYINIRKDVLVRLPEIKQIFTKADGTLYAKGDQFKQLQLAETLMKVAAKGASYMYTGEWAKKFVDSVRREGGNMTLKDLEDYKVLWNEPIQTTYRDYDVFTLGFPGTGGVNLVEALNLLEAADIAKFGHYATSPDALYGLIQISRVGYFLPALPPATIKTLFPDLDISPQSRLKKETAKLLWAAIQSPKWRLLMQGIYKSARKGADAAAQAVEKDIRKSNHSDAVVAVDEEGNVAAICHSINTVIWGTTGIFVDGVSINDSASIQQQLIKAVGPGVRLPDPTNPAIFLKSGKPVLASSSIGSGLLEDTLQNLVNILNFGMDPKTSEDTPKFLSPDWGGFGGGGRMEFQTFGKGEFSAEILLAVRTKGQDIKELKPEEQELRRGYWIGIKLDPATSKRQGAVMRHYNGYALGY